MADSTVLMATFQDLDRTVDTLDGLRDLGIPEHDITIMTSVPYTPEMTGRGHRTTILPVISLISAVLGLMVGIFFTVGTPLLYPIAVGGQPFIPPPPTALLLYEFTMLFLVIGTFLGMLWINLFPSYGPQYYNKNLTNGRISLVIHCDPDQEEDARRVLSSQNPESVEVPERRRL